jgi:hypothetical protein
MCDYGDVSKLPSGYLLACTESRHSSRLKAIRWIFLCGAVSVSMLLAGCTSQTFFQSNFDSTAVGQPPAHAQQVGTINIDEPPRATDVVVIASPVGSGGKWVQIGRPMGSGPGFPQIGLQGVFAQAATPGTYTFSTALYVPSGTGIATVQFETYGQPIGTLTNFLHLDFTQQSNVRLDDIESTRFGTFPHDQAFIVQVTLNTSASSPTAHIVLSGAGATGQTDYTIQGAFHDLVPQFGAIRLWMGAQWTGSFDATDIVVTGTPQ